MTPKVATERKMKSRQETTSLCQIATVTAKPTISDKERWFGKFITSLNAKKKQFRQFSLRFRERILSVNLSGPSCVTLIVNGDV